MGRFPTVQLKLPDWIDTSVPHGGVVLHSVEARMEFVIRLARRNVAEGTGGPFAAAIFLRDSGELLAPGVNCVVPAMCSVAHAEMVAIMVAQQIAKTFDLGGEGLSACELVTSTEPCAMCLGAIPWSGVRRLVCGARREDAERHGFDEGERAASWVTGLTRRGIDVVQDVRREEAADVLRAYQESGGLAYNGRLGARTEKP
ncbi:MAG: nucleoside deaminase [Verrucomicrobia bacterium]|nr:nucleoside deaminase [Verrucomicrobiota bacterium]